MFCVVSLSTMHVCNCAYALCEMCKPSCLKSCNIVMAQYQFFFSSMKYWKWCGDICQRGLDHSWGVKISRDYKIPKHVLSLKVRIASKYQVHKLKVLCRCCENEKLCSLLHKHSYFSTQTIHKSMFLTHIMGLIYQSFTEVVCKSFQRPHST